MNFDQFKNQVENLNHKGEFTFGFNWYDYVKRAMNEEIINTHCVDLYNIYEAAGFEVEGKSVFDIGCGSGLSSLSFARLGASKIYSIDVDPYSTMATNYTKDNFSVELTDWSIETKSVFDGGFDSFDLVYSWGVLHHTGNMWKAIQIAKQSVSIGGYFHIALYRSGPTYLEHLKQKQVFASLNCEDKMKYLYQYTGGNTDMFSTDSRGMNKFHDALDWLGGLPYEVCHPEELNQHLHNFNRVYFKDGGEGGNFVAIYQRLS